MKLVGERRALAAAVYALFTFLWLGNALQAPEPFIPLFYALLGVYGLAFFGIVAGYFWARWYAIGVGLFGIILAGALIYQLGALEPIAIFFGGTHLTAILMLWGDAMSEPFDGQRAWRDRYHMDDNAVQRLGRSVIRAGVSLPFVLIYGLAPKPEGADLFALAALGLAVFGFAGIVRMRTWGMIATGAAGVMMLSSGLALSTTTSHPLIPAVPALAIGIALIMAVVPFARPMGRWIAAR